MRKIPIILSALLMSYCSNSSDTSSTNNATTQSGTTATSKGCTSSQAAFRIKNSTASTATLTINTGSSCNGTNYPTAGFNLSAAATSAYDCAPAGTYYVKIDTGISGSCSANLTISTNSVYTFTATGNVTSITASIAQD